MLAFGPRRAGDGDRLPLASRELPASVSTFGTLTLMSSRYCLGELAHLALVEHPEGSESG